MAKSRRLKFLSELRVLKIANFVVTKNSGQGIPSEISNSDKMFTSY